MTLQWLLGWWNLVFLVPFVIALTYLGIYVSTGITFGDGADANVDADADHGGGGGDVHADADAHINPDLHAAIEAEGGFHAEAELGAEAGADADHAGDAADHDADHHHADSGDGVKLPAGTSFSLLHLIGVGRVPLSLLVMILLFSWGIGGFATVQTLHNNGISGERAAVYAMPFAGVLSLSVTALLSRFFGKVFPMNERPATSLNQLVGRNGVAVLPITDTFGLARVQAADGAASVQVPCRVAPGQAPIESNRPLVVMRFDRQERLFYVTTPDRLAAFRSATTVQ